MSASRAFVLRQTRLRPVPDVPGLRLHLTDDVLSLWRATQLELGVDEAPLPYWAFAWAGGLALVRYLRDHPEHVRGRRVFDVASGSGIVAIEAMRLGASGATAADIDPFATAAIELNARANGVRVAVSRRDVLDDPDPPMDVDVVLAADCWYEAGLARRVLPWLRRCAGAGLDVLTGDPARQHLPKDELVELARYDVRTTTELEDLDQKTGFVYALRPESA